MVTGPSAYGWPKSMTLAVLSAKSRLPPKLAKYSDSTLSVSDLLLSSQDFLPHTVGNSRYCNLIHKSKHQLGSQKSVEITRAVYCKAGNSLVEVDNLSFFINFGGELKLSKLIAENFSFSFPLPPQLSISLD